MKSAAIVVALVCSLALVSACVPPYCDHVDYGTCGNACCNMTFTAAMTTDAAEALLFKTLSNGGPDGRYKLSMTAEGSLGFADFTNYNLPVNYLGQVIHHTKVHHYNDTINISIAPVNGNTSVLVTAFSISQIAGAYGDAGQNFKNIMEIFAATPVSWNYKIQSGCPAPASPEPVADNLTPEAEPEPEVLHASCKLTWTFPSSSCASVSNGLAQAINSMTGFSNCVGEKCGYTLESANATGLAAYHETPVHRYRDDITMHFSASSAESCNVYAYSTSTIWYAVFDDGTNYCNLHNLATASGLHFSENVSPSECTQVATANCAKY